MIAFKTIIDLTKLSRDDPSHAVIQDILADFPRDADIHDYIVSRTQRYAHMVDDSLQRATENVAGVIEEATTS